MPRSHVSYEYFSHFPMLLYVRHAEALPSSFANDDTQYSATAFGHRHGAKGSVRKNDVYSAERSVAVVASALMIQDVAFKAEAARSLFDDDDSPTRSEVDSAISSSSYAASSSVGRALMLMDESNLERVEDRAGDGRC